MAAVFDIIFAGGGTTACVVAGRLVAANPSLKILIVESGQHSRDVPHHVQPCRYLENIGPQSDRVTLNVAKPSPHLNGRAVIVPCGRSVGGGSAVNFMLYVRGAASDYDEWSALGNDGWSFADALPLFKKLETFTPIQDRPTHGYSGPTKISTGGVDFGCGKQFLEVARKYDPDRLQVDDNNDFKSANAYSLACRYINPVTGRRTDAASTYLYPHADNPNLKITVGARVKRVIIENGRAVRIEYIAECASDEVVTVTASKLIVVSAGAFGSPSILERSGIGAPSVLWRYNLPVLVELPGVGENYQDHLGTCPAFYASAETETMDDVWADPQAISAHLQGWEKDGTGKIAHNGIEAVVKMRPTAAQLAATGPALQSRWDKFFKNSPDRPLGIIALFAGFPLNPGHSISSGRKVFSVFYYLMYPDCVGSVHITSAKDSKSPLEFDPGYCSKPGDVAQLTMLYKMARELARRMPAYRGEVTNEPVPTDAPDIVYSKADDEAIETYIRDNAQTTWHSLGTCAMKPREQGGVVDARLNVYGVEGLKVADMSICPTNVGNNTYSTALLVGEKAATIIAEDLGIALK